MTYYGIEQTTDRRYPETKVVRLGSERVAQRWLAGGGGVAWAGAADPSLPHGQQNFHHRFRSVYVLRPGARITKQAVDRIWRSKRDCGTRPDIEARLIRRGAARELVREKG